MSIRPIGNLWRLDADGFIENDAEVGSRHAIATSSQ